MTPFWQSKPPIYLGRARRESLHAQAPHRAGDGLVSGHRVNLLERYDYPLQISNAEGTTLFARDVEPSVPYALAGHLSGLSAGASVLVYCDRGRLDSLVWADPLKALGYRVDVLGGGWGNYRRWVDAGLEVLPRALTFRRLLAQPISGLCLVLDQLADRMGRYGNEAGLESKKVSRR